MYNTVVGSGLKCIGVGLGWTTLNLSFSLGTLSSIVSIIVSIVILGYFLTMTYHSHIKKLYAGSWKAWLKDVFYGFWKK